MTEPTRRHENALIYLMSIIRVAHAGALSGEKRRGEPPKWSKAYEIIFDSAAWQEAERLLAIPPIRKKKVKSGKGPRRRVTASANVKQKRRGKSNA
jgi:hypothetical protein